MNAQCPLRNILVGFVLVHVILSGVVPPAPAQPAADGPALSRIAFGSCVHQDDPQPVWDAVLKTNPQLFLMIGDNIYNDVVRKGGSKDETMAEKYAKQAKVPGFAELRKRCPLLGTWDDHDYGKNDAGAEYANKKEAQQLFLDFFGVPKESPRRKQEGIYHAEVFGPPDQRVQVILLDTRYFRSPLKKRTGPPLKGIGPYVPNPDRSATMLGEAQWRWLEQQLKVPAKIRILASSIQVVAEDHGWEKWMNLPYERERLYQLLRDTKAAGVVCISGDRHLAELSMMDAGLGYPLYDLTSSGLTQGSPTWRPLETNSHRVATMNMGNNFGVITIDWSAADPIIRLQIRDEAGEVTIQEKIRLSLLQPGVWKSKSALPTGRGPRLASGEKLTPEFIKANLKKEITLEMEVQATGASKKGDLIFLNSATDRMSEDNFTVVLDRKAQESLKKAGVADPRKHFEGKTIRVTGTLSLFQARPQIIVSAADRVSVVP